MATRDITVQLVLKFLKDRGFTESFLTLETESKINLRDYPKEIEFFKKILMKGDFSQAVQFIWAFQQKIPSPTLNKLTLEIYKQKLYELLENPEEIELRNLFEKQIINYCSEEEYQHLFTLLTCRSVKQIQGMDNWTTMKGRYSCFQLIQPHLETFFNVSLYQKAINRNPQLNLEEVVESFISAEQKVEQRMEKSQATMKPVGTISQRGQGEKQSKESIESESSKYQKEAKAVPKSIDISGYNRSYLQKANPNSSLVKQTLYEEDKRNPYDDVEMSQSKVQKPPMMSKTNRKMDPPEEYSSGNNEKSTLLKKYNLYVEPKDEPRGKISIEEEDRDRKGQKDKEREKQKQKQKEKEKEDKGKSQKSYLKQFEKSLNQSDLLQEEVRRNIAYLDQNNNSVVYKDEDNQNFTFSNGAEESGMHERNRKIIQLASLTDPKAIRTCQFSPSGGLFALGTNSSYLKLYSIQQLLQTNKYKQIQPICQIPQLHTKSIYCLDWSQNEKSIATCSNDLTIKITEFPDFSFSNYKTTVIGRHDSSVRMIKFNQLENRLVSCADDSLLKVWDLGKVKKCTTLKGHTQSISAFKFANDQQDNIIYSVSKDCTVRKWDLRVADCVSISDLHDCQLTYIADNTDKIVASDKLGNVLFYSPGLQLENQVKIHEGEIRSIDGSPYEDLLLTGSFDGHVCIFSEKGLQYANYHQHNENREDKVVYATFLHHPEMRGFASTSTMGICNIYSFD